MKEEQIDKMIESINNLTSKIEDLRAEVHMLTFAINKSKIGIVNN